MTETEKLYQELHDETDKILTKLESGDFWNESDSIQEVAQKYEELNEKFEENMRTLKILVPFLRISKESPSVFVN